MNKEEVFDSLKTQLSLHIDLLKEIGVSKAEIDIVIFHYYKKVLLDEPEY